MVIKIKIMAGYALLALNLVTLGVCVWNFRLAGLGIYAIIGTAQLITWASRKPETTKKKNRRETAFVRSNGEVYSNGKRISLKESRKRGLRLEYEDEPKPKKKTNFWNGR
jgi:hypothetical protein